MRPHLPLLALLGLVAAVPATRPGAYTLSPDAPQVVKDWLADQPRMQMEQRDELARQMKWGEDEVAAIKKGRITGEAYRGDDGKKVVWTFDKADTKRKELAKQQAALVEAKARLASVGGTIYIEEEKPLLVGGGLRLVASLDVEQVINASTARVVIGKSEVWLEGVSTSTFTDGTTVTFSNPLILASSEGHSYKTVVGGQKTIPLARPIDPFKYLKPAR